MADSSSKSSYQSLGNGVYRVGAVHRSAVTGRYVTKNSAAQKPISSRPAPADERSK